MVGEEERQIRAQERESLRLIIQQWNSNRLDLFEISEPDENLVFHGVMRFYFQDSGQKVATKCIRVTSTTTTRLVIETLIEKFRPDMRMLSVPQYSLYEIHENGDERRLADDEKPLLVQLNWNKDDREGRFLLRRMDINGMKVKTLPPLMTTSHVSAPGGEETFTRKLSKREKKELKKQEKMRRANEGNVAEKLYTELPETSFTRSISNPEAVMQRRRAQKLEKKLQQFRSKDGGPDTGGTLKIYGESLCQDVPYKTLLLSVRDTAASVVREMLEKYGLNKEDPAQYCLVQCIVTAEETVEGYQGKIVPQKEYVLDEDECPLAILMNHPPSRGSIMFQVRRRQLDHGQRRRKKKPMKGTGGVAPQHQLPPRRPRNAEDLLPFLVELGQDGSELGGKGRQHLLQVNVTEVGSDRSAHTVGQSLQLFGPHIQPRHCVIAHTDGIVTVTPCSRDAETYVNFQRIYETTILQNGSVVRFGKIHSFRFVDPQQDEGLHHHSNLHSQFIDRSGHDVTGKIDHFHPGLILGSQAGSRINSLTESQNNLVRPPFRVGSELQLRASMPQEPWNIYEKYGPPRDAIHYGPPRDPILPAVLEFHEEIEDAFFHNITTQLDPTDIQFKLAPTYTLYMAARFRASTHYRPELTPTERAHKLTLMLTKVSTIVHQVIEVKQHDSTALAFWMANASELLHFLRQDRHICGYSLDAQDILAEAVQFAFKKLVDCMQAELSVAMPEFLEDRDDSDEEEGVTAHVLSILTNTMAQLRRCRVNAALSIQLFSHLFHYISAWVFNKIVVDQCPNYCTRLWGERVKERLSRIELWAEKGGLEFAADRDLAKLSQASLLLVSPKSSPDDVATLSSSCFKLNSLQLREMLEKYETEPNEVQIPKDFVESVVTIAETTADCLAREDGREIRLEEEPDLQVQFLVPEDGYSCDIVRGVPSGLAEFLEPLQMSQLCRMTPQPTSSGFWTIYMHNHQDILNQRPHMGPRSPSAMSNRSISIPRGEPEVHTIQLQKSNSGMGLSIVATKGENQDRLGIYIKSVVPGGAADQDGRLQAGDQLLSVDGKSLLGISQEEAAQYMVGTGPVVTLEVARQGALYHGLAPLLAQPSPPQFSRGVEVRRGSLPLLTVVDWTSSLQDQSHHLLVPPHTMPHIRKPPEMPRKSGLIPNSKSNPNIASAGVAGQRREAVLPSQTLPTNFTPFHHVHHPQHGPQSPSQSRIQASKSVPSLNSNEASMGARNAPRDAFSTSYSRTSSTSSGLHQQQQQQQQPIRSKSTQNLNEGPLALMGRHPSSPALHNEDDRHYQNVSFHQGPQDPKMGSQRGVRPNFGSGQLDQRPMSAFMQRDALTHVQRPSSQQNLRLDLRQGLLPEDIRRREDRLRQSVPLGSPGFTQGIMSRPPQPKRYGQMQLSPTVPTGQLSPPGYYPHSAATIQNLSHSYPPQMSPQYSNSQNVPWLKQGAPPPTAPKPNRFFNHEAPDKPSRHTNGGHSRPTIPEEGYRDSPPPPPPPASTHPLLQANPIRAAPLNTGSPSRKGIKGPWDKDEKEKYEMQKREAAHRWRDEQIAALESLELRTPKEEERMNTLKLEKEFQKRAEAAQCDEDEEEGLDVEAEKTTSRSSDSQPEGGELTEESRTKAEEIRMKQRELEMTKEAEQQLLREAQRRQEEEMRRHHRHQHQATQRLDSLLETQGTVNGVRTPYGELNAADMSNPLPPERGSSYSAMHNSMESRQTESFGLSGPAKRVQFSETSSASESMIAYEAHQDKTIREDPYNFINDAENFLNSSPNKSTGNTPGVIGAQEVYRDPRQRRLMEQAQKAAATRSPGPEKLTFREKMKMFAMEAEEVAIPKKAQREVDSS